MSIAILFARADSIYKNIPGCDVYDINRDALTWPGGCPVVAHPPCRAWAGLRQMAKPRPGEKELAIWAVAQIQKFGGVLEHPSTSTLWPALGLPRPGTRDVFGGWTLPIHQHWFGHRARKSTFLYIVGCEPTHIPAMPMRLDEPTHILGASGRRKDGSRLQGRPEISKAEREHTPNDLAYWLVDLAGRCNLIKRGAA